MSKPREFGIYMNEHGHDIIVQAEDVQKYGALAFHVIEKSAYNELERQLSVLRDKYSKRLKQIAELESAADKLAEALDIQINQNCSKKCSKYTGEFVCEVHCGFSRQALEEYRAKDE